LPPGENATVATRGRISELGGAVIRAKGDQLTIQGQYNNPYPMIPIRVARQGLMQSSRAVPQSLTAWPLQLKTTSLPPSSENVTASIASKWPQGLVESSRGGIPETVRSQEPAAGATSLGRIPQPPPDQSGLPGSGGKFQRGTVLRARNDQPAIRPSRVCKATRPEGKCHNPSSPDQSGPLALQVWWRVPEAAS
jgi:hypothetical protein